MMSAHEDFWLARAEGAKIVDLDSAESLRLLAAKKVGRLAFVCDGEPLIMPMNFIVAGGRIVFRTLPHGAAAGAVDTTVAFEVDDIDDFLEAGWSVVVTGTATLLSEEELTRLPDGGPAPWADGARTLFVAIATDKISGRQLIPH